LDLSLGRLSTLLFLLSMFNYFFFEVLSLKLLLLVFSCFRLAFWKTSCLHITWAHDFWLFASFNSSTSNSLWSTCSSFTLSGCSDVKQSPGLRVVDVATLFQHF
jgi:hypothetical protein